MFYTVIGNDNYRISDENKVERIDGSELDLEIKDGKITIPLYGLIKTVELEWLKWLSYFKLELPKEYRKYIDYYIFKPIDLKSHKVKDPVVTLFKEPIYVKDDFRLIARYPRYAINEKCDILRTDNGKINRHIKKDNEYSIMHFKDSRINKATGIGLHRIVAFTWLDESITNDFTKRPVINHIDGNKGNNHYSNLEWTSFSENTRHVKITRLNPDGVMLKVYDLKLNTITFYNSISEFSRAIGQSFINNLPEYLEIHKQKVFKNRYIVKLATDTSKFDTNIEKNNSKIYVNIEDKKYIFTSYDELQDTLIPENKYIYHNRLRILKRLKEKYGNNVSIYKDSSKVFVKNIKTNEVCEYDTIIEASRNINVSKTTIARVIDRDKQYPINGYVFSRSNNFDSIEIIANPSKPVKVIAKNNSEKHEFNSLREAGRYFNCTMKTVKRALNKGNELNGYTLIKY